MSVQNMGFLCCGISLKALKRGSRFGGFCLNGFKEDVHEGINSLKGCTCVEEIQSICIQRRLQCVRDSVFSKRHCCLGFGLYIIKEDVIVWEEYNMMLDVYSPIYK